MFQMAYNTKRYSVYKTAIPKISYFICNVLYSPTHPQVSVSEFFMNYKMCFLCSLRRLINFSNTSHWNVFTSKHFLCSPKANFLLQNTSPLNNLIRTDSTFESIYYYSIYTSHQDIYKYLKV